MNNIITVIEIMKLRRFKSNNIQCWQLPGPVSLANIFSLELFISLSCTPQIQLHCLKTPRAARAQRFVGICTGLCIAVPVRIIMLKL